MKKLAKKILPIAMIVATLTGGCAPHVGPPITLTREQFATLYDDDQRITDVWYMGSDADNNYFCMEHWTPTTPDASQGRLDFRKIFRVPLTELRVKRPFGYTQNEDQWRLLRPHGDTKATL